MANDINGRSEGDLIYEETVINDINCIEIVTKGKKPYKEVLGQRNMNTPLLDSRIVRGKGMKEYCDAIVYTDGIKKWDEAFSEFYSNQSYSISKKDIAGGFQKQFVKSDTDLLFLSFYPKSNMFMLQPGPKGEETIRNWLYDFSTVRDKICSSQKDSSDIIANENTSLISDDEDTLPKVLDDSSTENCATKSVVDLVDSAACVPTSDQTSNLNPHAAPFALLNDHANVQVRKTKAANGEDKRKSTDGKFQGNGLTQELMLLKVPHIKPGRSYIYEIWKSLLREWFKIEGCKIYIVTPFLDSVRIYDVIRFALNPHSRGKLELFLARQKCDKLGIENEKKRAINYLPPPQRITQDIEEKVFTKMEQPPRLFHCKFIAAELPSKEVEVLVTSANFHACHFEIENMDSIYFSKMKESAFTENFLDPIMMPELVEDGRGDQIDISLNSLSIQETMGI